MATRAEKRLLIGAGVAVAMLAATAWLLLGGGGSDEGGRGLLGGLFMERPAAGPAGDDEEGRDASGPGEGAESAAAGSGGEGPSAALDRQSLPGSERAGAAEDGGVTAVPGSPDSAAGGAVLPGPPAGQPGDEGADASGNEAGAGGRPGGPGGHGAPSAGDRGSGGQARGLAGGLPPIPPELREIIDPARMKLALRSPGALEEWPRRAVKAALLARRSEALLSQLALSAEEFNLRRLALEKDRAAGGGRAGALQAELSTLTNRLKALDGQRRQLQNALDQALGPFAPSREPPPPTPMPAGLQVSGAARAAVQTAYAQIGKPYVWAGAGPGVFDCSGLTQYSWKSAGVSLPHSARLQAGSSPQVPRSSLSPGDLVYFGNPIRHVGMYVGDGKMIHAPKPGDYVRIAPVPSGDYAGATRPGR